MSRSSSGHAAPHRAGPATFRLTYYGFRHFTKAGSSRHVELPGVRKDRVNVELQGLDRAPEGYEHSDARDSGWAGVVLSPAA